MAHCVQSSMGNTCPDPKPHLQSSQRPALRSTNFSDTQPKPLLQPQLPQAPPKCPAFLLHPAPPRLRSAQGPRPLTDPSPGFSSCVCDPFLGPSQPSSHMCQPGRHKDIPASRGQVWVGLCSVQSLNSGTSCHLWWRAQYHPSKPVSQAVP